MYQQPDTMDKDLIYNVLQYLDYSHIKLLSTVYRISFHHEPRVLSHLQLHDYSLLLKTLKDGNPSMTCIQWNSGNICMALSMGFDVSKTLERVNGCQQLLDLLLLQVYVSYSKNNHKEFERLKQILLDKGASKHMWVSYDIYSAILSGDEHLVYKEYLAYKNRLSDIKMGLESGFLYICNCTYYSEMVLFLLRLYKHFDKYTLIHNLHIEYLSDHEEYLLQLIRELVYYGVNLSILDKHDKQIILDIATKHKYNYLIRLLKA